MFAGVKYYRMVYNSIIGASQNKDALLSSITEQNSKRIWNNKIKQNPKASRAKQPMFAALTYLLPDMKMQLHTSSLR